MAPFRRRVQNVSHCKPGDRHCSGAREYNVFSRADSATEVFPVQPEPTDSPTSAPTSAPTKALPDCDSLLENDSVVTDGQQRLEVTYLYQVQTTIDQSVESLHDTVLGQLENELNSLLLRSWLNGVLCRSRNLPSVVISEDDRLQIETSVLTSEEMIITDISTAPKDLVRPGLDGVRCRTSFVEGARRCFIVGGGYTIVGEGNLDGERALDFTEALMDQGFLDKVHEDVRQVRFVGEFEIPKVNVTDGSSGDRDVVDPVQGSSDVQAWPWVLLSLGLLTILLCFFLVGMRRRRKDENRDGHFVKSVPDVLYPQEGEMETSDIQPLTSSAVGAPMDTSFVMTGVASSSIATGVMAESPPASITPKSTQRGTSFLSSPDSVEDAFRRPFADSSDDEDGGFPGLV